MNKDIFVNIYFEYLNEITYFIGKTINSSLLAKYIMNYFGEIRLGRTTPKELDVLFIVDDEIKDDVQKDILLM